MASENRTIAQIDNDNDDWRRYEPLGLTPLLTAALDAFYEHGFHGTTVRDIARRVGQTVPSLYYHHENKEGAIVALLELATNDLASRSKAAATAGDDRPDLQFANVIEAIVLHMTHRVRLASLDTELRYLSPQNRKRYATTRKEVETLLAGIVGDGVERKIFTTAHPSETARGLLGMCQSIARWYHPEGEMTPEEVADRYVDIALMTVGVHKRPHRHSGKKRGPAKASAKH